jgi:glucose-1-phosphate cytidylyltransferase
LIVSRGLLHYLWRCGRHRRCLAPHVFGYIKGNATVWRNEPLERLARNGEVMAYRHDGFWQPMDSLQEGCLLEDLGHRAAEPWHVE